MNNQPAAQTIGLKGAVALLGSLYWEGNEPNQDGDKGSRRKEWRSTNLDMTSCRDLPGIAIRYGRRSQSRNGEFTIVFGGKPEGVAKMANLQTDLSIENGMFTNQAVEILRREVRALAEVEGISTNSNPKHVAAWGLVAVLINPESEFKDQMRALWKTHFTPGPDFDPRHFGEGILDCDGILQVTLSREVWKGLSFLLCTPTKPEPRDVVPTPADIAKAIAVGSYLPPNMRIGNQDRR